jgi:hypothetical protein
MFRIDADTHKQLAHDRIDSLNRSRRIEAQSAADTEPAGRHERGGITPAPSLSVARPHMTAARLRSSRA